MVKPVLKAVKLYGAAVLLLTFFSASTVAITTGYRTNDSQLKPGMVVSLTDSNSSEDKFVERASPETANRVVGVAVNPNDSSVIVGSDNDQVYVESSDEVEGLVSDLGGEISDGDVLAVSPLRGLLMKAEPGSTPVAVALEDFDSADASTLEIEDEGGASRTVKLLKLSVSLGGQLSPPAGQSQPNALERFGETVVNKDVTSLQVIIALIIFVIMLVGEGSIIYAAISSSITSLGRNPLAKNLIKRELLRTVFIAFAVLGFGIAAIYAILWI